MVDVTGRRIENGDILLEIYNNGKRVFIHVAHGGFTAHYVRTIQVNHFTGDGEGRLYKSQVKPKGVIILTEEQFLSYVEKYADDFIATDGRYLARKRLNLLLDFSKEQKAKQ